MPVSVSLLAASVALRVASLNLCTDEYLLMLARPDQVASVTRLSQDPADSPLWRAARRFPSNRGDLESAMASRPTVLLTMGGGGRATELIAKRLDIRTIDLPFSASIDDVIRNMSTISALLGTRERATRWTERLARLRNDRAPVRDAIFLSGGGLSLGDRSIGAEWMSLVGLKQRRLAGGRATLETIATDPPEILLRSDYRRREYSLGEAWLDHPLVRKSRARQVETDGRRWTCAGPLMLSEIERLKALR
jgi:iron complex transport system substrate-binding protein